MRNKKIPPNFQRIIDNAWLGIDVNEETLFNPLEHIPAEFEDDPHLYVLWLMQQPEYFSFICKEIFNVQLLPVQALVLTEMWHRKFPMLIACRGFGKSFMLALYSLLRILLLPSRKVVIVGAAFRQSKVIFNYMESIWYNAPLFRDLCGQNAGPRHEPDMFRFHIGDSVALALPIGDGSRIRGQRANDIIADEFAAQSKEVFENVIAGFGVVTSSPVDSVKERAAEFWYKKFGIEQPEEMKMSQDNQVILSGTAFYDFNHFGEYWKRWKEIIRSKGDPRKLDQIFGTDDNGIPEYFSWKDYSIIRLPFELIPKGFMDEAMVARSKATIHSGIYLMEFGACVHPDTLITTDVGVKKITNVKIGDYVLTHRGRFRKVTKVFYRKYSGPVINYKTVGYNQCIKITPEHPFWIGDDKFDILTNYNMTCMTNLNEVAGQKFILPEKWIDDILETRDGQFLYPRGSRSSVNLIQQREIKRNIFNKTQQELAIEYNTTQSSISYIQNNNSVPKNRIPTKLDLDYNFGLIVGYYAAEGNISKNGNAVEFSLDEHKDTQYQIQLLSAIKNTFGFCGKSYYKKDNTCVININSRIVADIIKEICPGKSATKLIAHHILFSTEEFLRGAIEGYWNGDGHTRISDGWGSAHCINQSLLNQIRIGLSYFNISSSLMNCQDGKYKLNISGENFRQFLFEFYNKTLPNKKRKQNLINDGTKSIHRMLSYNIEEYDGFVYNLEVEEDNSYSLLNATVHNCFSNDSNGFFKRSLIESCVISNDNEITLPSGKVDFKASLQGKIDKQYIFGIDPASEVDNFSIVVLEHYLNHRRIVYVWTTNAKEHKERIRAGLTRETDFYSYCARKVRDLMKVFPCARIAMDSQGGGVAIREALHDIDKIRVEDGEVAIWPIIDSDKPNPDTDGEPGLHIIEMCNFSSADWTGDANHGLRKDFEDKVCLFPFFDSVSLGLARIIDEHGERLYDTLEDCYMEIEELKNELSTIIITQTLNGRDRWDTPEIKLPGNKKGRLRKDRYSALVMANMASRTMARNPEKYFITTTGGWAGSPKPAGNTRDYTGADWISRGLQGIYD